MCRLSLLAFLKPKARPRRGPRGDLPDDVKAVVRILEDVKDPETGLNVVEEGLVYGLTVKERSVDVFMLMAHSTPECHFCQMLAISVQNRILKDVVEALKRKGFERVKVYNELGLLLAEG
ncbi:iron-sulfur cluster assembly protein [Thermococcus sp. AM4]|uniref:iron-sulfur cluster assembly protein n=1 Tax=Thermococcus sp. (strain AM4) TaxID=246969 RepID=UPI00352678EA